MGRLFLERRARARILAWRDTILRRRSNQPSAGCAPARVRNRWLARSPSTLRPSGNGAERRIGRSMARGRRDRSGARGAPRARKARARMGARPAARARAPRAPRARARLPARAPPRASTRVRLRRRDLRRARLVRRMFARLSARLASRSHRPPRTDRRLPPKVPRAPADPQTPRDPPAPRARSLRYRPSRSSSRSSTD